MRVINNHLLFSVKGNYIGVSSDWKFIITHEENTTKIWKINIPIIDLGLSRLTGQLTEKDIKFLRDLKKPISNYVYPKTNDLQEPWMQLIIKLAEYNLSFDVNITEEISIIEMDKFDIQIDV
ncbi:hypothetical protein IQ218_02180 [Synechocystis salina LEGE 06099]|uniref:hypothetical protein n=1 Tax=Synechocystis salina TaxID=945780 RepID=UPI00187E2187|nr:hypothetical protein [Synechocystis salina]MBE9202494.1 hypothetical protein [Synechocystis salina LEGE 06099]